MSTPQKKGREFEVEHAKALEGELIPGSGNQWHRKMDVRDGVILWSCKSTDAASFRLKRDDIDEVVGAVEGPGGVDNAIPGLAIRIGNPDYDVVVLRKDDFLKLIEEDIRYLPQDKSQVKRETSKVPELLRESG